MKKIYSLLALTFVFATISTQAAPRPGFDGCYQLHGQEDIMYPAFCLQGTTDEGTNGSGVRLAIFGPNTDRLTQCLVSTSSSMTETSFVFELNGKAEMIMKNIQIINGRKVGDALIAKAKLKFIEINSHDTNHLMYIANSSANCF
ncbi:MAG: hypothetical protein A3K03_09195 [Bdellovibrionales bacterium RIFOXYD1_FULL_44_7]|nr:MAG: hypothetical protein A3K03_09195 [Bdellovibrionales bacterium RIFOXYD1_FULL_44_7]